MHALCHFMKTLLRHFRSKQQAYKKTIHNLLAEEARIINPKCRGGDTSLSLDTNSRKGVEFSIVTELVGLTYLTRRKTKQVKRNTKPCTLIRI